MTQPKRILGPDGAPLARTSRGRSARQNKVLFGFVNRYLQNLGTIGLPVEARAQDPFSNHAWVFAGAIAIAMTASSAPFAVWRETEDQLDRRRDTARKAGRKFSLRYGHGRRAIQRLHAKSAEGRLLRKGMEPDWDHPLMELLVQPNAMLDLGQLWMLTHLWLAVRGECFWVKTTEDGDPVGPGELPGRIWILSPDLFKEAYAQGQFGEQVGWWYTPPKWMPNYKAGGRLALAMDEVVHYKPIPDPANPSRGISRLTASAAAIEMDLMIEAGNRNLLRNEAVPRGIIQYDGDFEDDDEADDWQENWEQKYQGANKKGRMALLHGGFKYIPVAFSPQDMQYLSTMKWDRETTLANLGVPPSVLGVTEFSNYATALAQDRTFIDKTIMPLWKTEERTLDAAFFFDQPDDVFGAFDLTGVDALRVSLESKVDQAKKMAGPELHMPPVVAYELVGLEVPEYPGDDQVLVSPLLKPVENLLEDANEPPEPDPIPAPAPAPTEDPDAVPPATAEEETTPAKSLQCPECLEMGPPFVHKAGCNVQRLAELSAELIGVGYDSDDANTIAALLCSHECSTETGRRKRRPTSIYQVRRSRRRIKASQRWEDFVKVQEIQEAAMTRAYRAWVREERTLALKAFDDQADGTLARRFAKTVALNIGGIVPDPDEAASRLTPRSRPVHMGALEAVYDFTAEEVGVPLFDITDDALGLFFDAREAHFVGLTTGGLIKGVRTTLSAGIQAGESIDQIRKRLTSQFNLQLSSAKALTVARTETAGFMNGARNEMIGLQGFTVEEWSNAGDEHVRADHVTFDAAGPQERGFDYMTIAVKSPGPGPLEYPGDMRAGAAQVIHCRCIKLPLE